jgi:hypothetical protein
MATTEIPAQLVVVGASAGGIEALSTFVATLPAGFPAPIVIAQHLDPTRPSHLGEILARRSSLPVITVEAHAPLSGQFSGQGLGLGLYICRQIVTGHGGTIMVTSTESHGATFTLRLPLLDGEDA